MSKSNTTQVSASCTEIFLVLLGVLFIGLKLTGYIDWSWLWVLAPLWIPLALVVAILLLFVIGSFVYGAIKGIIHIIKTELED